MDGEKVVCGVGGGVVLRLVIWRAGGACLAVSVVIVVAREGAGRVDQGRADIAESIFEDFISLLEVSRCYFEGVESGILRFEVWAHCD